MIRRRSFVRGAGSSDAGFSLPEVIIATAVLLVVFGAVSTALSKMTNSQRTIWNRTQMHSGVRGATELLQQEVGQAGLVALPGPAALTGSVAAGAATVGVTSTAGMFVGQRLVVGTGAGRETVAVAGVSTANNQITATFQIPHDSGEPVQVFGGFATGVVPPGMVNGSSGIALKLYGDINGDGDMVYVEYTCDPVAENLYRNVMPWDAPSKPAVTSAQVLLSNVVANPGGTPCFTYQLEIVDGVTYVTAVAITLTVRTQLVDPITREFQTQTKALLNVSPRNVFNVWQHASIGITERIQPMPASIANLLAD